MYNNSKNKKKLKDSVKGFYRGLGEGFLYTFQLPHFAPTSLRLQSDKGVYPIPSFFVEDKEPEILEKRKEKNKGHFDDSFAKSYKIGSRVGGLGGVAFSSYQALFYLDAFLGSTMEYPSQGNLESLLIPLATNYVSLTYEVIRRIIKKA